MIGQIKRCYYDKSSSQKQHHQLPTSAVSHENCRDSEAIFLAILGAGINEPVAATAKVLAKLRDIVTSYAPSLSGTECRSKAACGGRGISVRNFAKILRGSPLPAGPHQYPRQSKAVTRGWLPRFFLSPFTL